jgi:SAM-dependent methyltransferase
MTKPTKIYDGKSNIGSTHLDFGAGRVPRNPFCCENLITVDVYKNPTQSNFFTITKGERLPFEDCFFDSVSGYDVLEHLSREPVYENNEFIFYMNEISRVLKFGGIAVLIFPAYPHRDAFSDPTHINFISKDTVNYFLCTNSNDRYSGISTQFEIIHNKKLRFFGNWHDQQNLFSKGLTTRRRLSLMKRDLKRIINPGHRIWILRKIQPN